jgi:hypothetical protein
MFESILFDFLNFGFLLTFSFLDIVNSNVAYIYSVMYLLLFYIDSYFGQRNDENIYTSKIIYVLNLFMVICGMSICNESMKTNFYVFTNRKYFYLVCFTFSIVQYVVQLYHNQNRYNAVIANLYLKFLFLMIVLSLKN